MKLNVRGCHRSSLVLRIRFSAIALVCAALALTAPAADIYWSGNGDGTSWNSGANWTGGTAPGAADVAYINVRNNGITMNGTGTFTVRQIIFNVPTTLTIPAECTLYLSNSGSAVLDANANVTVAGGGDLSLSTGGGVNYADVRPAAGVTITINARITGVGGVENNGAGTVVLTNPLNAYPGLTYITVANGVIEFPTLASAGTVCAIGTGDGFLATVANSVFRYTGTAAASTDRPFAINNTPVSFEQAGSAPVTLTGTVTNQTSGTRTFQLINNTSQPATFAGLLANGPGTLNLLKGGSGTWTLTTANTYSGSTTVSGGTLELIIPDALGPSPIFISGGATLALTPSLSGNYSATLPNVTVTGSGRITIPAASTGTSTLTFPHLTVVSGVLVIDAPGTGTPANRILVSNGLTAGPNPIPWIRLNGGAAQYDSTDGLKPYTSGMVAGIAARGGVIPQAPGQTVPITTPGTSGPVTLTDPLTEVGGLSQQETATAATVDLGNGILAADQIDIVSSGAALTLGNGTLTAAGFLPTITGITGLNTVSTAFLTDDASTGISSFKTYTHALDFGNQAVATINGVAFTQVTAASGTVPGTSFGWSGFPTTLHENLNGDFANVVPESGLRNLLRDMVHSGNHTVKLTGLTPGAAYEFRLYTRTWDGLANTTERTTLYSFHTDANAAPVARLTFDKNHNPPTAIVFRYIAASTELTVSSTTTSATGNPYAGFFGLTNEQIAAAPPSVPTGLASLILWNDSTAPLTVSAAIADNGRPVSLLQSGTGPTVFTGPIAHTGVTTIDSLLNLAPASGIVQTLGPVYGAGGITKSGAGTSVLQGANTYTGPTRVEGGMLLVADSAALGLPAAGTVVESGAALALTDAAVNTIAIKDPITFEGAGPDGLGALRTETLSSQQNAFQLLTLSGNATVGGSAATPNIPFDNSNGRFDLRNGTLDLAGHSLTKAGPGAFVIVASEVQNVAPGTAIDVTGGALALESATDLQGSSGNTLTVRTGANIDLYRTLVPQIWTLALEDGAHFSARSANSITENIWDGPVSLTGGQALFGGSGTASVAGQISGSGGILKARGTTYLLNGDNQYSGATTVTNGVLYAAAPGSLPDHTPAKLNIRQNGTLAVRYADDAGTRPLAWGAADVDAIATTAFFTQSSATLGFDPYYADATYGTGIHGFSLSKHGANTLTHTGANNDIGTVRVYDGELVLAGGAYSLIGTSSLYPGATGSTASYGILSITGNAQVIGADPGYRLPVSAIAPGQTGNSRGILNIRDNAFVQGRLYIADNASGAGAIYQSGGTFNNVAGAATDGRIGHNGYGYYQLDGGAVTNKGYTQLAAGGSSIGILRQTGGEFIYKTGNTPAEGAPGEFYGGTFSTRGGTALLHLSGGVLDTGNSRLWLCEFDNGSGGYTVLTLEDEALLKADYIDMADRNASPVTIVNLNGGTIQTKYLRKGNRDNPTDAQAIVNFSGGTLLATSSDSLITSAGETAPDIFVYGGGAVIDTTNYNTSITFPIKKPENYGVTGIRVITPGTGYIAPPFVKITGGGGRGATAVAEIDRVLGSLTAIRVTSPGTGFTSVPTVTLLGGGAQTAGTIGLTTIGLTPRDGGLAKRGTGALALSGANTWAGPTVIEDGILSIAADNALPPEADLFINGGTLDLANRTVTNAHTTLTSGEIINGEIVTASLRKETDGEAFLKTSLTLTTNAFPRAAPTPGLWEGVLFRNWDVTTPNPKASIVLTTRAGNGAKAENTVYANGSWAGGNHTWVYSGYIWNHTSANVTWSWRGTFDDNVMLKIDQVLVLNTGNSGTTATHTLTPGPHAIEIRFGDGTGSVGPEAGITNLGGLTYDTGDGLGLRILEDPGDGSLLSVDLGPVTPLPPANALPAEIASNVGELAAGYSLVYASDIPASGSAINAGSPYTTDNSAASANIFDRVAYYVELVKGGETQWVWVSFDAVSHDRSLIGYPTSAKRVIAQSRLSNMDVRSNVPGISGTDACQTGNIEFWPNDYSQADALGLGASSAGDNTGYDFGDTVSGAPNPSAGRGSMQIHNAGDGATLFAISNFGNGNNTLGIGIGNNPAFGAAPDWTSANNAGDYTARRLYVLTRDIMLGAEPPSPIAVVAAGTLRLSASKAGLYEGCIYNKNWDPDTPNPNTSIQLTTRAGNGKKAHNSTYAGGLWAGNNHTWIYTGFLWNNTDAPVTWTFWASFDDYVTLTIDGTQRLYDNNSGGTRANVTLKPGANPIEIRFGDGGGDAGPNNSGLPGGLSYTTVLGSTNPADYHVLADPGDGSLLTTVDDPSDTYVSNAEWEIADGAALDLNGETAILGAIRGAGTVTNGTLGANTVLSPGGDGNIDTLALADITFGGTVEYRVDIGAGTASDRVTSTTPLDLTNLRVTINNPSALQLRSQYLLLQANGGFTGTPDVSALPDKWRLLTRGNELFLFAPSGTLMILR